MLSPSHQYGASSQVPVIGEDSKADAAAASAAAAAAARAKSLGLHTISHSGVTPPLDFSFQDITTMAELVHHEPAGGRKLPTAPSSASAAASATAAASASLGSPKSVQVLQASSPSHGAGLSGPKRTGPRVAVTGVRIAYNALTDLKGFVEAMEVLLGAEARTQLTWLDLSHNKLSEVDDVLLLFPNLTTLYLHGNLISSIAEVKKLSALEKLSKLTLHGCPIYEPKQNHGLKNPRSGIIYHLRQTQLRSLDFVTITNADRRNSLRWAQQNKPKKKRRTGEEGDDDEGSPVRR